MNSACFSFFINCRSYGTAPSPCWAIPSKSKQRRQGILPVRMEVSKPHIEAPDTAALIMIALSTC